MISLEAVGFCAHYSEQGDWAFQYALGLAQQLSLSLNVFHFLSDPYVSNDQSAVSLTDEERNRLIIEREKKMRLYYDSRAGDYLNVGFRLCEDTEWIELHKCLMKKEFQVLVLGYTSHEAQFAGKPIQDFCNAFVSPVVLVGPERSNQYRLNKPAALIVDKLGLSTLHWEPVTPAAHAVQPGPSQLFA